MSRASFFIDDCTRKGYVLPMRINTQIRYGLRMVVEVARHEGLVNTAELGKSMGVSPKYLRKLAGPLEKAGILRSAQGIYGGYRLNREPASISLADVMSAFGESMLLVQCLGEGCVRQEVCLTRGVWRDLATRMSSYASETTVAGMLLSVAGKPD